MPNPRDREFHVWTFGWINENAAVRVEQRHIAFGQDLKILSVFEIGPRRSVREGVGMQRSGHMER
jgi:hypothetical protein